TISSNSSTHPHNSSRRALSPQLKRGELIGPLLNGGRESRLLVILVSTLELVFGLVHLGVSPRGRSFRPNDLHLVSSRRGAIPRLVGAECEVTLLIGRAEGNRG